MSRKVITTVEVSEYDSENKVWVPVSKTVTTEEHVDNSGMWEIGDRKKEDKYPPFC